MLILTESSTTIGDVELQECERIYRVDLFTTHRHSNLLTNNSPSGLSLLERRRTARTPLKHIRLLLFYSFVRLDRKPQNTGPSSGENADVDAGTRSELAEDTCRYDSELS